VADEPSPQLLELQRVLHAPCEPTLSGGNGQLLRLATALDEAALREQSSHGPTYRRCIWKVGDLTFAGSGRVTAYLKSEWRGREPFHILVLVRDGSVRLGQVSVDDA